MDAVAADFEEAQRRVNQCLETGSEVLDLSGLKLDRLPIEIAQCVHLTALDCSGNAVFGSPLEDLSLLVSLENLQRVACSYTQVSDLSALSGLSGLQSVACGWTQVSDLSALSGLSGLQSVACSYTQVSDLSALSGLSGLQNVYCSDLEDVTASLEWLRHGFQGRLFAFQTRIFGIPEDLMSRVSGDDCLPRIRAHLEDLEADARQWKETKVLFLGNGLAGKTQLRRALAGDPFDTEISTTHGIEIQRIVWAGESSEVRLRCWDFGGQDIYHGTHALFMRCRAIFVVVWRPKGQVESAHEALGMTSRNFVLEYWLEQVRHLATPGSVVLAVQSQCDEPGSEEPFSAVETQWKDVINRNPLSCSAKTRRGMAVFKAALEEGISDLQYGRGEIQIGAGRAEVIERIQAMIDADAGRAPEAREHRILSKEAFQELCEEVGAISSPDLFLEFLNDSGLVFHRAGVFGDQLILDQSWALDAIYGIFEREKVCGQIRDRRFGRFDRELLELTVWQRFSKKEQALFLSMMESCGVAFEIRQANAELGLEAEYLAPDLLPAKDQIESGLRGRWDEAQVVEEVRFSFGYLHQASFREAQVAFGSDAGESAVYWDRGVCFFETKSRSHVFVEVTWDAQNRSAEFRLAAHGGRSLDALERVSLVLRNFSWFEPSKIEASLDARRVISTLEGKSGLVAESALRSIASEIGGEEEFRDSAKIVVGPPPLGDRAKGEYFVSYAWGDDSPEGIERDRLVDSLCDGFDGRGITLHRDKKEITFGDRITPFMNRLARGDRIFVLISGKYMRSVNCMYELFHIYRNADRDPEKFVGRIIPLVTKCAKIGRDADRLDHILYWAEEKRLLDVKRAAIEAVGGRVDDVTLERINLVGEFANNVGKLLVFLNDIIRYRDFDDMAGNDFEGLEDLWD